MEAKNDSRPISNEQVRVLTMTTHESEEIPPTTQGRFMGVIPKKYLKTIQGLIHGTASTISLILGNAMIFIVPLLPSSTSRTVESAYQGLSTVFFTCSFISALTTLLFFWGQVQAWRLSTTSPKEKGLTPESIRRFNQGRGVVAMLLYTVYPMTFAFAPSQYLESRLFSASFAFGLTLGSAILQSLLKGYSEQVFCFVIYGLPFLELAGATLSYGTIAALNEIHPRILEGLQSTGCFIITGVQFGFFFYYLYSRGLVTKSLVQRCCSIYHPILCLIWSGRLQWGQWWKFAPGPALLQTAILSTGGMFKLFLFCGKSYVMKKNKQQQQHPPQLLELQQKNF